MDIKRERGNNNNGFLDNFTNWVCSRKYVSPPEKVAKPKPKEEALKSMEETQNTKNVRVHAKKFEMKSRKASIRPVKSMLSSSNGRNIMSKQPFMLERNAKRCLSSSNTGNNTSKRFLSSRISNGRDNTDLSLLSPKKEEAFKAKIIAPPLLESNNIDEQPSIAEAFIIKEEDMENFTLDESRRVKTKHKNIKKATIQETSNDKNRSIQTGEDSKEREMQILRLENEKKSKIASHSKVIQTEFTCKDNICGIIDTQKFNINCFYCYTTFPIKKWYLFINHIKLVHPMDKESKKMLNTPLTSISNSINKGKGQIVQLFGEKRTIVKTEPNENEIHCPSPPNKIVGHKNSDQSLKDDIKPLLDVVIDMKMDVTIGLENSSETAKKQSENNKLISPVPQTKSEKNTAAAVENIGNLSTTKTNNLQSSANFKYYLESKKSKVQSVGNHQNQNINVPSIKREAISANGRQIHRLTTFNGTQEDMTEKTSFKNNSCNVSTVTSEIFTPQDSKETSMRGLKTKGEKGVSSRNSKCSKSSVCSFTEDWADYISWKDSEEDCYNSNSKDEDSQEILKVIPTNWNVTSAAANKFLEMNTSNAESGKISMELMAPTTIKTVSPKISPSKKKYFRNSAPFPSLYVDSEDEMPSNDENEDEFPSSTNGCGILFGLTNRKIVLEFLKQLENYPVLYKCERNKNSGYNFDEFLESITNLRSHINAMFNIDMTEFETRLSIQRVKYWYCRTLQKKKHAEKSENLFKSTFLEYFEIMDRFLTVDVSYTKDLVLSRGFQSNDLKRYPTWMVCRQATESSSTNNSENDLEFDEDEVISESEKDRYSDTTQPNLPPEPLICDICFVDFQHRLDLKRHRIIHFPPKHPCSICCRMHYTRKMARKCLHKDKTKKSATKRKSYQTEQTWVCEICGINYKSIGSLNYHQKDKHFDQRYKCGICKFSSLTIRRLLQHQSMRHVVEFGTCEEIAKRTRPRTETNIPYTPEARQEFLWLRGMRKLQKPGEHFFGCFKCKLVFKSRREKIIHNQVEHPVTEAMVVCLLCKDKILFSNMHAVRRHYTCVHKVPWYEIDDLTKRTKTLLQLLSQDEFDIVQSSDHPNFVLTQILAKKSKAQNSNYVDGFCEDIIADVETGCTRKILYHRGRSLAYDDDSNDDLDQSTLYNDFAIDHDSGDSYKKEGCNQFVDLDVIESAQFNEIQNDTQSSHFNEIQNDTQSSHFNEIQNDTQSSHFNEIQSDTQISQFSAIQNDAQSSHFNEIENDTQSSQFNAIQNDTQMNHYYIIEEDYVNDYFDLGVEPTLAAEADAVVYGNNTSHNGYMEEIQIIEDIIEEDFKCVDTIMEEDCC